MAPGPTADQTPPRQLSTLHRTAASSRTFAALDRHLWRLTYKWACHSHPNKPKAWITSRYYGRFCPTSQGSLGLR